MLEMPRFASFLAASLLLLQASVLCAVKGRGEKDTGDLVAREWNGHRYGCKCYPGDKCWPKDKAWKKLNETVDGNLVVNVPPEASCHNTFESPLGSVETYDAAKCAEVTANYADEQWSTDQNALLLWKYFTNHTCIPTEDPSEPCSLGYYGVYVILAETKEHVKAGVDFARENNLRLIIRNTGHDFIGRSTGWGSLIINTHSFQDVEFMDRFHGPGGYAGGAVKIGAGVQGAALLEKAATRNLAVVVGECPTVGVAGGYIQGGGHGPMTTLHGLAADNAIEFEVITASGESKTVNSRSSPDLFWALKGGGPGTFAVVLSVTLRTFPEVPSAGGELFLNFTHTQDPEVFWEGFSTFHKYSNHFVDNGMYVYFEVGPLIFRVKTFVAIDKSKAELEAILAPMVAELTEKNIPFDLTTFGYDSLHELYVDLFEPEGAGAFSLNGGWMFSRKDVEENNDEIVEAVKLQLSPREDLQDVGYIIGHLWNAGYGVPDANSATHPAFRDASDFMITILPVPVGASTEEKKELEELVTNVMDPALMAAGPNGCTYVNEADPYQDNWQEHFWGPVYPDLKRLKKKWDPKGLFYAISTPGTEEWEVIENGTRLCKRIH